MRRRLKAWFYRLLGSDCVCWVCGEPLWREVPTCSPECHAMLEDALAPQEVPDR